MRTSVSERFHAFIALGFAGLVLWCGPCVDAQVVIAEREQAALGSVQVGDYKVLVLIAYEGDSALVMAAIPGSRGNPRYIPLIGSTYRGVSSFRLDVHSSNSSDEIWIRTSDPQSELLAHYRLGSETALTQFGRIKLLETPFPEHLSGGPVPFPNEGPDTSRIRASFFHYDDM